MLKRLFVKNFTVFAEADFEFGPGLNVIVGTNGTGKSHVLKLGYIAARVTARILGDELMAPGAYNWQNQLARRLKDVFQVEEIGQLVRWAPKKNSASIVAEFEDTSLEKLEFGFSSSAKQPVILGHGKQPISVKEYPKRTSLSRSIFIPPKEVLTLSWLTSIYEKRNLPIDDTYPSLLDLLREIPLREISPVTESATHALEEILGGRIEVEGDKFYLVSSQRRLEMNLVAEGIRKFALLERLLRNGVLVTDNVLFWDEPEANLNPALLKKLAAVLAELARQGFQIILATHSSFLLKQLHILNHEKMAMPLPIRYFGLNAQLGEPTVVTTTDDFAELPDIVALDEELAQAGEFLDVLNDE